MPDLYRTHNPYFLGLRGDSQEEESAEENFEEEEGRKQTRISVLDSSPSSLSSSLCAAAFATHVEALENKENLMPNILANRLVQAGRSVCDEGCASAPVSALRKAPQRPRVPKIDTRAI